MSDIESTADVKTAAARATAARQQRSWSRFLLVALALHIPLYFYPILRLCAWLGLPWWATALVFFPLGGSQIIARLYLRGNEAWWARAYKRVADFWLGLSPLVLLGLIVSEVVVAGFGVSPFGAAVTVILAALAAGALGVVSAIRPIVKRIAFDSARLAEPVRFVQITDVHIGSRSSAFLEDVVSRITALAPDFLCITGDFIDAPGVTEDRLQALKRVACPIYYCIGNHEKYEDLDEIVVRLANLGVNVLRNASTRHRDDLQVIGIDDMDDAHQVERELANLEVDRHAFTVLLYHRPRGLEAAAAAGVDLMLSGHTHNGQIMPFNLVVGRVFDKVVGMHRHGDARLYVSQGTGTWGPVMRVGTRSEITLFEVSPSHA